MPWSRPLTQNSTTSLVSRALGPLHLNATGLTTQPTEILTTTDAEARLKLVTQLFTKLASISEVSNKIASVVDESLSKQQKEHFLRQKLAAIQKELQNLNRQSRTSTNFSGNSPSELDDEDQADADDMAQLRQKIEAMTKDSEERKVAVSEWRRLKRIPSGSAENAVIRTYVSDFPAFRYHARITTNHS